MKNNKGFSLVELLAVLAILGILFVIGITAYSRHKVKAIKQGYETMAKSASQAASEYKMDHPAATAVTFDTLHKNGYLSSLNDPGSKNSLCSGSVNIKTNSGTGSSLDEEEYTVAICCSNYNYTYYYPSGNKVENNSGCHAEENMNPIIPEYDITYKITYDTQGGKECKPSSKTVFTNEGQPVTWGTLCKPTKTNYEFNGWYTSDGKEITSETEATGDIRVYAHWTPSNTFTYMITYDPNGGSGTMTSSQCVKGKSCTLKDNQFTYSNHEFVGWFNDKTSGTMYGSSATFTSNKTVYAHWCQKCSTVSNGTCSLNTTNGTCKYTTTCNSGYHMVSGNGTPNPVCEKDSTTEYVTITYNPNGGSGTMTSSQCVKGKSCTLKSNTFTYNNHEFVGWFNDKTSGTMYGSSATFTSNKTVYAHWCQKCSTVSNGTCSLNTTNGTCKYTTTCNSGYHMVSGNGTPNPVCEKDSTTEYVTITYNPNGGSGTMTSSQCVKGKSCTLKSNTFTYNNHEFVGWFNDKTSGTMYGSSATFTSNKTVYAHWCQKCSTVSNGTCSLNTTNGTCKYTTTCNSGYHMVSGNGTPNPVCEKDSTTEYVTITYNPNGGSGTMTSSQCVKGKSCTLKSNTFTYNNHEFVGWFNDKTSGTMYGSSATFTSNKTVYAHWCQKCSTVSNGTCSLNTTNGTCKYTTTCNSGYHMVSGNGTPNPVCEKDSTTEYVTITYNPNGGSGTMTSSQCVKGKSCTLKSNTFTYNNHEFVGWFNDKTSGTMYGSSATFTSNKTVYAHWCQKCSTVSNGTCSLNTTNGTCKYTTTCNSGYHMVSGNGTPNPVCEKDSTTEYVTITYNPNGGSGTMTSSQCVKGKSCTLKDNSFTYSYHKFTNWYDKNGNQYESSPVFTNDTTVYAHWRPYTYTIKFDSNNINVSNSNSMSDLAMTYGETKRLPLNTYAVTSNTATSKQIYTNWNDEKDGRGTSYNDGENVKDLVKEDGGTKILYAQWIDAMYRVSNTGSSGNETKYALTLKDAIDLANNSGSTITLINNYNDGSSVSTNKSVTLSIPSGKTLTRTSPINITGGTFNIKGNGTIYYEDNASDDTLFVVTGNGRIETETGSKPTIMSYRKVIRVSGSKASMALHGGWIHSKNTRTIYLYNSDATSITNTTITCDASDIQAIVAEGAGTLTIADSIVANGLRNPHSCGSYDNSGSSFASAIRWASTTKTLSLKGTTEIYARGSSSHGIAVGANCYVECLDNSSIYSVSTNGYCVGLDSGAKIRFNSGGNFYSRKEYVAYWGANTGTLYNNKGNYFSVNKEKFYYGGSADTSTNANAYQVNSRNISYLKGKSDYTGYEKLTYTVDSGYQYKNGV